MAAIIEDPSPQQSYDELEGVTPVLADIPIKPQKELCGDMTSRMRYDQSDRPAICFQSAISLPPIIVDTRESLVYDMGPEMGGKVKAYLHIVSEPEGSFKYDLPLRLFPYKTAADPSLCFNTQACRSIDAENTTLVEHNKYITSLMSLFIHHNGCGTSANHVTLPPPPEDLAETRLIRLRELFKDKHSATILAVRYLHAAGKVCEQDYAIENAVEAANAIAYEKYIKEATKDGKKFRFRIPGSPPASWDGNPDHRDSMGRRVKWNRESDHSFISPSVRVTLAQDELVSRP